MTKEFSAISKSPIRVDARDKVMGKAMYIDDIKFPICYMEKSSGVFTHMLEYLELILQWLKNFQV